MTTFWVSRAKTFWCLGRFLIDLETIFTCLTLSSHLTKAVITSTTILSSPLRRESRTLNSITLTWSAEICKNLFWSFGKLIGPKRWLLERSILSWTSICLLQRSFRRFSWGLILREFSIRSHPSTTLIWTSISTRWEWTFRDSKLYFSWTICTNNS